MSSWRRFDFLAVGFCCVLYVALAWWQKPVLFTQTFDHSLLERYHLSQDIPVEVPGKRVFLSDSEIHLSAGYLYATEAEPTQFNFQHPPLAKYLYGLAIVATGKPQLIQLSFGAGVLIATYALALLATKQRSVALLATVLLAVDPTLYHVSLEYLLDLPQSFFFLAYLLSLLTSKKSWLHGLLLAAILATKFWGGALALLCITHAYVLVIQKMPIKKYMLHLLFASIFFNLAYIETFIAKGGWFNFVFFQLKVLKYWLHHSVSAVPGASFILFTTGLNKIWWGTGGWVKNEQWFWLWPLSLGATGLVLSKIVRKRKNILLGLVTSVPLIQLVFLGVQAPFVRYFIVFLPYLYIGLAYFLLQLWQAWRKQANAQ